MAYRKNMVFTLATAFKHDIVRGMYEQGAQRPQFTLTQYSVLYINTDYYTSLEFEMQQYN